ncbi:MAG: hypothetical protein CSA54_05790 [Gammaproteobacteria bacterium]|nr:MAG: hypothetical protein CSA54_05790 [Gammaproteobacteria bacterium]
MQPAIIDGVRVLSHHETPGLGDPIERERSDWIEQFRGRRIAELATAWSSGRTEDGFDALTGASITSMAVLNAVQRAGHDAARHVLEESNDVQDSDGPEDPSGVEVLRGQ